MTLQKILDDLEDYLEYKRDEGATSIEVNPQTVEDLSKPVATRRTSSAGETAGSAPASASSLEAVTRQIAACTKCSLHETRTKVVPGQGGDPVILAPQVGLPGQAIVET